MIYRIAPLLLTLLLLLAGQEAGSTSAAEVKSFALTGGLEFELEDVSPSVDVYFRSMRLNAARNEWNFEVSLSNKTDRVISGPLILYVDSFTGTSGPLEMDGFSGGKPFVDLTGMARSGSLGPRGVSTLKTMALKADGGKTAPVLKTKVFAPGQPQTGALGFVRTLDEFGLPLPDVAIQEQGPAASLNRQSDRLFGVSTLGQGEGRHVWKFTKAGYHPVWRTVTLRSNEVAFVPYPRLSQAREMEGNLTPVAGGTISNGTVKVDFPVGAFSQNVKTGLTPLTGQTLPAFLPSGWSPLAAFWVNFSAPPISPGTAVVKPWSAIETNESAVWVKFDEASLSWKTVAVQNGAGTNTLSFSVPGNGAFAIVVADKGATGPPAAVVGIELPGGPSVPTVSEDLRADGTVNPSASVASTNRLAVTSEGVVAVTNLSGALSSGTVLRGEVKERYILRDGSTRWPPSFETFLAGYQRPGDELPGTVHARFPLQPQLLFGPEELEEGLVHMDVFPTGEFTGGTIKPSGGMVADEFVRIFSAPAVVNREQAVFLRQLTATNFLELTGGMPLAGAFEIGVEGVSAGNFFIPQITGTPANSDFVLARVVARSGLYGLEPRQRFKSDGKGTLSNAEPATGERLPGFNEAGQYLLLRTAPQQGIVSGVTRNAGGVVSGDMPVTIAGQPWLTFSDSAGAFKLLAPAGANSISTRDLGTQDSGSANFTVPANLAPVDVAVGASLDVLRILSISPTNQAALVPKVASIKINFTRPLNPGTIINGVSLATTNGQVVPGNLTLNLAGTTATFLPNEPLASATTYRVQVAESILDLSGRALTGEREFIFTTVPDSIRDPAAQLIIYEPGATNIPPAVLEKIPAFTPGLEKDAIVVNGTPGAADPEVAVVLVNESTGETSTVLSKPDGSFASLIRGTEDDFVSATFVNLNGTRVYVPVSRQQFDNGFVGLYRSGGILEAESDGGPVKVLIAPGAISSKAKIRLKKPTAAEIEEILGDTEPEDATMLAKPMILEAQSEPFQEPLKVSFPVSIKALPNMNPADAAVALVRVVETDGVKAFEVLDQLKFTPNEAQPPPPGPTRQARGLQAASAEQTYFGVVDSVIGLIPQSGIANNVFRYALMPVLIGGHPIIVKGRAYVAPEAIQLFNPLQIQDPTAAALFSGFSFSMLGRAFNPLDQFSFAINTANQAVQTANDLLLGRALGGAFITLQNIETPNVPGRIRPGMVYATSAQDGTYLMVAPTTPWIEVKPNDFYLLLGSHPRFSDKIPEQLFALNDLSIAGVAFKNFVFRQPLTIQTAPTVNVSHKPAFPAPGQEVEVQVNATQGFRGEPEVRVFVESIVATDTNVTASAVEILDPESRPLGENRTRWTGKIKAPESVLRVKLGIITLSSASVASTRIPHIIDFTGRPPVTEGPIPPSDPTETRGPAVVATFPTEGGFANNNGEVTLVFNEPIDRSVERNASGITLHGPTLNTDPAVRLSPDQTVLTLQFAGLAPDAPYSLTVGGASVVDLLGNPLNQSANINESESFTLNFRTPPVARYDLPSVVNGVGAAISGIHAYVLDNTTPPVLRCYDISKPESPILLRSVPVVGTPRDVVVVPQYAFKPSLHKPAQTNDLVVVVGGDLDTILEDLDGDGKGDNVLVKGQYMRVFDAADPANLKELAAPILTYRVSSVVPKVRWIPPYLVYQEYGQDMQMLGIVNLQEMLIGFGATRQEIEGFRDAGTEGVDKDGDGNYVGPEDKLPIPPRRPPEFFGKKQSYVVSGTTQKILDFSVTPDLGIIGVSLTRGLVVSQNGQTTSTRVPPQYRTLTFHGFDINPSNGSIGFDDSDYPGRVAIFEALEIEFEGKLQTPAVAILSLSPNHRGSHSLALLDITFPESARRIGEVEIPEDIAGGGIKSIQLLSDGRLELTTASHVVYLNPRLLAGEAPPSGQLHPAIIGFSPFGGGRMRSVGGSDLGLRLVSEGARNEIVQTAPSFTFIHFPTSTNVIDPRNIDQTDAAVRALISQARAVPGLFPARVRPDKHGHQSDLTPPNPAAHFHVFVSAPGGAGEQISLGLEALNYAGWPIPNKGAGFAPVKAVEQLTLDALGMRRRPDCDAPVRSLTAYRLSDDPNSPFYNQYLSRPFAVVYEALSIEELDELKQVADREILWSGAKTRVFIESTDFGQPAVGPFAAQPDARNSVLQPPAYATAETLDVSYVMGPNPPPPGGDDPLDGTYGSVSAHSGEFRTEATDLVLPSPRMPIEITRSIGGQDTYEGPFGMGWEFNYNQRITELTPILFPQGLNMPLISRAAEADSVVGVSRDVLFQNGAGRTILFQWKGETMPAEYVDDPLAEELNYGELVQDYYLPEAGVFDLLVRFKDGNFERLTPDGTRYRYSMTGRLESITDRFPKNKHELTYDKHGWLRRIDDRSVTTERFVQFGHYRKGDDGEFESGLDEQTSNPLWVGKICRLRDYAGRDVLFFYNDEGLLIRREGVEVAGENDGFAGRNQTHYLYNKCRIIGVAVGQNKTPLVASDTAPSAGEQKVPVTKKSVGTGLNTQVNVPLDNAADKLENQVTTATEAGGKKTEITLDALGKPKLTVISGPGVDNAKVEQEHDKNGLLTSAKYPEGRGETLTYDTENPVFRSRGNLIRKEVIAGPRGGEGYTEKYSYDPRYNLPSGEHVDANGFTITYQLSGDGRFVRSIQHGSAGSETFDYTDRGQLLSHKGVDGISTSSTFDDATGFTLTTSKGNFETEYSYGGDLPSKLGQPAIVSPPRGAAVEMKYNNNLQEVEIKRGPSHQTMAYDEQGRMVQSVEVLGDGKEKETRLEIDVKGFVTRRVVSGVEVDGTETSLEYLYEPDEQSRVKQITHPGGTLETYEYNALGYVTKKVLNQYEEEYTPDLHGNVTEVKKGGDVVAQMEYDGFDRVKLKKAFTGQQIYTSELTYYKGGQLKTEKTTDPKFGVLSDKSVGEIDELGRPVSVTINGENVSRTDTTEYAPLKTITTSPRQTTVKEWNAAGFPTRNADSISESLVETDGNGNVEHVTRKEDGATYTEDYTYDELDHKKSASDALGLIAEFVARNDGKFLSVRNGRGNATTMEYSVLGELLSRRRADGMTFRFKHDEQRQLSYTGDADKGFDFTYDDQFRLTKQTLRNGAEKVNNSFDPRNQPTETTVPGGTSKLTYDLQQRILTSDFEFQGKQYKATTEYDALNRIRVVDYEQFGGVNGRTTYTYDKAGPLLSTHSVEDGADFTVAYHYRNDLARDQVTYPSGALVREERDNAGRLTGISVNNESIASILEWQGNSQPKTINFGGVLQAGNIYDARGRLVSTRYERIPGNSIQAEMRIQYDLANNVEIRQFLHRAGKADNFSYDTGERLARAQVGGILSGSSADLGRLAYGRSYQYQATGLDYLVSSSLLASNGVVPPFANSWESHDAFLLPGTVDGVARGPADGLGRVSGAQLWTRSGNSAGPVAVNATLEHDGAGRLVRITRADKVVIENFYQPWGLRFARKVTQGGTLMESRHYVYDDRNRLLEEYDTMGSQPALLARYYYIHADAPCAADIVDGTGNLRRKFFIYDDQNSVVAVADHFGEVAERIWYDPHGQPVIEPKDTAAPVIKRVVGGGGGTVYIELSEPVSGVFPDVPAQAGIRRINQSYDDLVSQPAGRTEMPEVVPGFAPYSVIVFTPEAPLSGTNQLTVSGSKLMDDWGNRVPAQTVTINVTGNQGDVYYVAANNPVTDSGTVARSTVNSPMLFHGQYFDYDTGLVYLRARFYDPFSGMFLQPDPMGYEDSVNLYAGLKNNPTSVRDPSGLIGEKRRSLTSRFYTGRAGGEIHPDYAGHWAPSNSSREGGRLDPHYASSWRYNPDQKVGARGKGRPPYRPQDTSADHVAQAPQHSLVQNRTSLPAHLQDEPGNDRAPVRDLYNEFSRRGAAGDSEAQTYADMMHRGDVIINVHPSDPLGRDGGRISLRPNSASDEINLFQDVAWRRGIKSAVGYAAHEIFHSRQARDPSVFSAHPGGKPLRSTTSQNNTYDPMIHEIPAFQAQMRMDPEFGIDEIGKPYTLADIQLRVTLNY